MEASHQHRVGGTRSNDRDIRETSQSSSHTGKPEKHIHHGRTGAAWAGTTIALVAFLLVAVAFVIGPNWVMFWVGIALLAVALIVTVVMRRMGYGAD